MLVIGIDLFSAWAGEHNSKKIGTKSYQSFQQRHGDTVFREKLSQAFLVIFLQETKDKIWDGKAWDRNSGYEDRLCVHVHIIHAQPATFAQRHGECSGLNNVYIYSLSDKHWLQSGSSLIFWVWVLLVLWRLRENEQKLIHRRLKVGITFIEPMQQAKDPPLH